MHIGYPKMKSRMRVGMSVNGMQKVASMRSLTERFKRNMFVIVLMPLLCCKVKMTITLPVNAQNKNNAVQGYRDLPSPHPSPYRGAERSVPSGRHVVHFGVNKSLRGKIAGEFRHHRLVVSGLRHRHHSRVDRPIYFHVLLANPVRRRQFSSEVRRRVKFYDFDMSVYETDGNWRTPTMILFSFLFLSIFFSRPCRARGIVVRRWAEITAPTLANSNDRGK